MVQTYQPPVMAVTEQTLPELQPIFTLLNSHSNKLYQEGYFLKLDDQDIRTRRPPPLPLMGLTPALAVAVAVADSLGRRRESEPGPDMDGMLCPVGWHGAVPLGCRRAGRCGGGWRGASQVHQSDRCVDQNGTVASLLSSAGNKLGVLDV
jgi:hypothetical protein